MSANSTRRKFFRSCACCEPSCLPASPARRTFLAGGAAALGLGTLATIDRIATPAVAQPAPARPRIDVHHHFIPQFHVDSMMAPGRRAGAPPPKWSPALSLEDMDKSGIATSILSIAQPGIWYGNNVEESRNLARQLNEYGAKMGKDHPGRFGLFAVIAPPDGRQKESRRRSGDQVGRPEEAADLTPVARHLGENGLLGVGRQTHHSTRRTHHRLHTTQRA